MDFQRRRAMAPVRSTRTVVCVLLVVIWLLLIRRSAIYSWSERWQPQPLSEGEVVIPVEEKDGSTTIFEIPETVEEPVVNKNADVPEDNEAEDNEPEEDPDANDDFDVDDYKSVFVDVEPVPLEPIKSIPWAGPIDSKRVIQHPGVPKDSYRWKDDYSSIKSGMDLPRIFPPTAVNWNQTIAEKTMICVFNRTPRQRSLWGTDVLAMFGSGKYHYESLDATDCQFFGTCRTGRESRAHPQCNPKVSPTVGLVEWVKCCFHDRFTSAIRNQEWDVAVATGDEYCASHKSADGKAHFRFYYDGNVSSSIRSPAKYLPLGPREEFRRVKPKHIVLAKERGYLVNFVGSLTSKSRRVLATVLRKNVNPPGATSFLHVIGSWSKEITRKNGYIPPWEYRRVLLNSTFTLCPDGHNPEAYRIYEAIEAGSIPIVALDQYYLFHSCKHAFAPFLESGAPFVYLNSWTGLKPFLERVYNKPELLVQMQANVMAWYSQWMRKKAMEFEGVMEDNFRKRTQAST